MVTFDDDEIFAVMEDFGCSFNEAVAILARREGDDDDDDQEGAW